MKRRALLVLLLVGVCLVIGTATLYAQPAQPAAPRQLDLKVDGIGTVSAPLQIVLVLTLLSFLPAILVTMTSFTRIVIVFHFLRQALGTQEMPSNQILIGLALFLTMFIMAPVGDRIYDQSVAPAMSGRIELTEAVTRATPALRTFMLKQTREHDLALFVDLPRRRARRRRTISRCGSSFPRTSSPSSRRAFRWASSCSCPSC